jgi:hypothetical protein
MVAYFIRRGANGCSVVKLYPDDSEEVCKAASRSTKPRTCASRNR